MPDQRSPAEQAAVKTVEAQLNARTMPEQIWLDAQGRVRRISTQLRVSTIAQSSGSTTIPTASGSGTTTVDSCDFGTPVSVRPPPASPVDDVTSLAVAAGSSTTTTGG